jgi:hypothetical protein
MPQFNARFSGRLGVSFLERPLRADSATALQLHHLLIWMFVNGFFISLSLLSLLSFAALLCLFGVLILIDGIVRLTSEQYKYGRTTPANSPEREEKPTDGKRAA